MDTRAQRAARRARVRAISLAANAQAAALNVANLRYQSPWYDIKPAVNSGEELLPYAREALNNRLRHIRSSNSRVAAPRRGHRARTSAQNPRVQLEYRVILQIRGRADNAPPGSPARHFSLDLNFIGDARMGTLEMPSHGPRWVEFAALIDRRIAQIETDGYGIIDIDRVQAVVYDINATVRGDCASVNQLAVVNGVELQAFDSRPKDCGLAALKEGVKCVMIAHPERVWTDDQIAAVSQVVNRGCSDLRRLAGVKHKNGLSITELTAVAAEFFQVSVKVYTTEQICSSLLTDDTLPVDTILLALHADHYWLLRKLTEGARSCHICGGVYGTGPRHRHRHSAPCPRGCGVDILWSVNGGWNSNHKCMVEIKRQQEITMLDDTESKRRQVEIDLLLQDPRASLEKDEATASALERDFVRGASVQVLGCAGSGKSTLTRRMVLSKLRQRVREAGEDDRACLAALEEEAHDHDHDHDPEEDPERRVLVLAHNAVALEAYEPIASICDRRTIHSFLGLMPEPTTWEELSDLLQERKAQREQCDLSPLWSQYDVLVLDEVSVIPGELFILLGQAFSLVLESPAAFGGLQLILTGDYLQRPPIPTPPQKDVCPIFLTALYQNMALRTGVLRMPRRIGLLLEHRDRTVDMFRLQMRSATLCLTEQDQRVLNNMGPSRAQQDDPSFTHLVYTNAAATGINDYLMPLHHPDRASHTFPAHYRQTKAERNAHTPQREVSEEDWKVSAKTLAPRCLRELRIKQGTRVMLTSNDHQKKYGVANGSIGEVRDYAAATKDRILVRFGHVDVPVDRIWQQGTNFVQFPLLLAYAITIDKSQGMTLSKVIINELADREWSQVSSRTHWPVGMLHVAMTRCSSSAPEDFRIRGTINARKHCTGSHVRLAFTLGMIRRNVAELEMSDYMALMRIYGEVEEGVSMPYALNYGGCASSIIRYKQDKRARTRFCVSFDAPVEQFERINLNGESSTTPEELIEDFWDAVDLGNPEGERAETRRTLFEALPPEMQDRVQAYYAKPVKERQKRPHTHHYYSLDKTIVFDLETCMRASAQAEGKQATPYYVHASYWLQNTCQERVSFHVEEGKADVAGEGSTMAGLMNWIFDKTDADYAEWEAHPNVYYNKLPIRVIAYNGANFDFHFIMRACLSHPRARELQSKQTLRSKSIVALDFTRVTTEGSKNMLTFWDPCLLLSTSLAKAAATLCPTVKIEKELFPHDFINRRLPENISQADDAAPDVVLLEDFPVAQREAARKRFPKVPTEEVVRLYNSSQEAVYFQTWKRAVDYCKLDVQLLERLVFELDRLFFTAVLPRTSVFGFNTIASASRYGFYRTLDLPFRFSQHAGNRRGEAEEVLGTEDLTLIRSRLYKVSIGDANIIRQAVYGGKTFPRISDFVSTQLEAVENKSLAYKDVTDALGYFDVHSMYVAVMRDNVFPYGPHTLVSSDQQDRLFSLLYSLPAPEKLFVMKCDVLPDPRELDPPIGWKPGGAKLCWDNRPKIQQWYTSVDLELAIASGCVVANPTAAYVWDLKGPILEKWVSTTLAIRSRRKKKGDAMDTMGKLLGNATYGSTLIRDYNSSCRIARTEQDVKNIVSDRSTVIDADDEVFHNGSLVSIVYGLKSMVSDENDFSRSTPHLGAFVLSYSHVMLDRAIGSASPDRRSGLNDAIIRQPYYSDTDSLFVHLSALWDAKDPEMPSAFCSLIREPFGYLGDDLENSKYPLFPAAGATCLAAKCVAWRTREENKGCLCPHDLQPCKILKAMMPAPKFYGLEYMDPNETMFDKVKAKGVPRNNARIYMSDVIDRLATLVPPSPPKKRRLNDEEEEENKDASLQRRAKRARELKPAEFQRILKESEQDDLAGTSMRVEMMEKARTGATYISSFASTDFAKVGAGRTRAHRESSLLPFSIYHNPCLARNLLDNNKRYSGRDFYAVTADRMQPRPANPTEGPFPTTRHDPIQHRYSVPIGYATNQHFMAVAEIHFNQQPNSAFHNCPDDITFAELDHDSRIRAFYNYSVHEAKMIELLPLEPAEPTATTVATAEAQRAAILQPLADKIATAANQAGGGAHYEDPLDDPDFHF